MNHLVEAADFRTTENLIFTPPSRLQSLVPAIPPHLLELLTAHCLSLTGPPSVSAFNIPSKVAGPSHRASGQQGDSWMGWGIEGLDGLLQGWNGVGVLEIAGPKRAGKSVRYASI